MNILNAGLGFVGVFLFSAVPAAAENKLSLENSYGLDELSSFTEMRERVEAALDDLALYVRRSEVTESRSQFDRLNDFVQKLASPPVADKLGYTYLSIAYRTLVPYLTMTTPVEDMTYFDGSEATEAARAGLVTDEQLRQFGNGLNRLFVEMVRRVSTPSHYRSLLRNAHSGANDCPESARKLLFEGDHLLYETRFGRSSLELIADVLADLKGQPRTKILAFLMTYGKWIAEYKSTSAIEVRPATERVRAALAKLERRMTHVDTMVTFTNRIEPILPGEYQVEGFQLRQRHLELVQRDLAPWVSLVKKLRQRAEQGRIPSNCLSRLVRYAFSWWGQS